MTEKLNYGNWIRARILGIFFTISLALFTALVFSPLWLILLLAPAAILSLGMGLFLLYLYYQFSANGGKIQERLWQTTLAHLHWSGTGRALDIGTGNGALAIKLAGQFPNALITAVDTWAFDWAYSRETCESNARAASVPQRLTFETASAQQLPYEDASFDAVVSHFVFHEVKAEPDKIKLIQEALRLLKPGGCFAFSDMYYNPTFYPQNTLLAELKPMGLKELNLQPTKTLLDLPKALWHPRVVGHAGILWGKK